MAKAVEDKLTALAEQQAVAFGLDVEKLTFTRAGVKSSVKIAVDADERPDLDLLEEYSQAVGGAFDAAEQGGAVDLGPSYTLEVSTPGVDFPLTLPRHFQRNIGRLANLPGGGQGRIAAIEEAEVAILPIAKRPKGKKGKAKANQAAQSRVRVYQLADLAGATIEVEFADVPEDHRELLALTMPEYHQLAQGVES